MRTRMTELFGIRYPVMCGGMMWLARPELCAAISNAGGMGNLTAAIYENGDTLREAIRKTRELTRMPFCVNITLLPSVHVKKEHHQAYLQVCCEEQVTALEISGAPLDRYLGPEAVAQAKRAGVKLIHKVGSVKHAKHAEEAGYDAVIAAGWEEGGHPLDEDVTTTVLTPRIRESVNIVVITAGGIADGRGLAAALALGADGVMMASRFMATTECPVHPRIKEELVNRQENETTIICKSLNLQMRSLKNDVVKKVQEIESRHGEPTEILSLISGEHSRVAWESGDINGAPLAVGQSIGLIKRIIPCKQLLDNMVMEAGAALANAQWQFQGHV